MKTRIRFALTLGLSLTLAGCVGGAAIPISCEGTSGQGQACTCRPNDQVQILSQCSPVTGENWLCCKDNNFPTTANSECSCTPWRCAVSAGSCNCQPGATAPTGTAVGVCGAGYLRCCAGPGGCLCDASSSSCPGGTSKVQTCESKNLQCKANTTRADRCSPLLDDWL